MKDSFIVSLKAALKENGKYLILKRAQNMHVYPNLWDFPGGKLESGEDVIKSLKREVFEETGFKIKVIKPLFVYHEIVKEYPSVFIVYSCKKLSGKIKLSDEHKEYKWILKNEIFSLNTCKFVKNHCLKAVAS